MVKTNEGKMNAKDVEEINPEEETKNLNFKEIVQVSDKRQYIKGIPLKIKSFVNLGKNVVRSSEPSKQKKFSTKTRGTTESVSSLVPHKQNVFPANRFVHLGNGRVQKRIVKRKVKINSI